tara:strand:- start:1495 stop:1737 length:243 start_codon:yes stop_codon:yes gene_type:complete
MKKSRILRALKKHNAEDLKKHPICKFTDEKGKSYFIGEEKEYMENIQKAMNITLGEVFNILDDDKLKEKIIKGFKKNDKK